MERLDKILEELDESFSLSELGDIVRRALSLISLKLKREENFGYEQHCTVVSFGDHDYDVEIMITDGRSYNTGEEYIRTYWI